MKKRVLSIFLGTLVTMVAMATVFTASAAVSNINLGSYFDKSKWTDDGGDYTIKSDSITFNNAMSGDFAAIMLKEEQTDANYQFSLKVADLPEGLSEEAGTWWDCEMAIMLRAKVAGTTYTDGQAGYCLSSFGDLAQVYIGKSNKDDYFTPEGIDWNINDGKVHTIEFSSVNNTDGTVTLKLVVDGKQLYEGTDKGEVTGDKKVDRQKLIHTGAGSFMMRCKYMTATLTAFSGESAPQGETTKKQEQSATVSSSATTAAAAAATTSAVPAVSNGNSSIPAFMWIIIAAAAVLLVGAVVVIVLLVIKNKKKTGS